MNNNWMAFTNLCKQSTLGDYEKKKKKKTLFCMHVLFVPNFKK